MNTTPPALLAQNIHKTYGSNQVLRGVSLRVEPGMYHGADICQWARSMRDFRAESIDALGRALRRD